MRDALLCPNNMELCHSKKFIALKVKMHDFITCILVIDFSMVQRNPKMWIPWNAFRVQSQHMVMEDSPLIRTLFNGRKKCPHYKDFTIYGCQLTHSYSQILHMWHFQVVILYNECICLTQKPQESMRLLNKHEFINEVTIVHARVNWIVLIMYCVGQIKGCVLITIIMCLKTKCTY